MPWSNYPTPKQLFIALIVLLIISWFGDLVLSLQVRDLEERIKQLEGEE